MDHLAINAVWLTIGIVIGHAFKLKKYSRQIDQLEKKAASLGWGKYSINPVEDTVEFVWSNNNPDDLSP